MFVSVPSETLDPLLHGCVSEGGEVEESGPPPGRHGGVAGPAASFGAQGRRFVFGVILPVLFWSQVKAAGKKVVWLAMARRSSM